MTDLFKIEGRRPVTDVRWPFVNTFLSDVVASYRSILRKYRTFSGFMLDKCNLRVLPDAVAAERDAAAVLWSQDRPGLGTSPPETNLKSTVNT